MKIAFFELEDWEKEYFEKQCGTECTFLDVPINDVDISKLADVEVIVIFIYSRITSEVLEKLPNLKLIATMSTGTDHIALDVCKSRGITVSNVPTYGEHTVAEHTFALLLALSRKIIDSYKRVKEWQFNPTGLTGFDISGKTLGVVGIGNIGKHVVRIAKGFEMNVIGYKRSPDPELEKELEFKIVDMPTLLSTADIISLHLPYSKETHHILNAEAFSHMKDGVIIINTARGALIDTNALMNALDSGKVAGAGLDVLEQEPLLREEKELLSRHFDQSQLVSILENHMLVTRPNIIITPHNAFNSREALQKIVETTDQNIKSFISGTPQNTI